MEQDEQGRTLVDATTVGNKWQVVDTILPNDHSYLFPAGNGRVGDSDREANVWIRDNNISHDLTGQSISIWGMDAAGKIKIVDGYKDATDLAHGKITLLLPKEMYQANGPYRELWLQINDGDQIVSTVNLHITVWENNIIQTWSDSEDYVGKINKMLSDLTAEIKAAQTTASLAQGLGQQILNSLGNNQIVTYSADGTFSGNIAFSKNLLLKAGLSVSGGLTTDMLTASGLVTASDLTNGEVKFSDLITKVANAGAPSAMITGAWSTAFKQFDDSGAPNYLYFNLSDKAKLVELSLYFKPVNDIAAWSTTTIATFDKLDKPYWTATNTQVNISGSDYNANAIFNITSNSITLINGPTVIKSGAHCWISTSYLLYG